MPHWEINLLYFIVGLIGGFLLKRWATRGAQMKKRIKRNYFLRCFDSRFKPKFRDLAYGPGQEELVKAIDKKLKEKKP